MASARTVAGGGGHFTHGFVGEDDSGLILSCESGRSCLMECDRAKTALAIEGPVRIMYPEVQRRQEVIQTILKLNRRWDQKVCVTVYL